MKEIRDIVRQYDEWQAHGRKMALATVVDVEGSAYRRPGARMLICDDGSHTGAVSGGCLDSYVVKKALSVIKEGHPVLLTYDNLNDDEKEAKARIGCNGVIRVLVESVDTNANHNPVSILKPAISGRHPYILATAFDARSRKQLLPVKRFLVGHGGVVVYSSSKLIQSLEQDARSALKAEKSAIRRYLRDNGMETAIFYEYLEPPVRLVIAGSGPDVPPLVQMAGILGWQPVLVDGKPAARLSAFAAGGCSVISSKPEDVLRTILPDDNTVFVLMTHNYHYDKELLYSLCCHGVRHIAMLGPAKKYEKLKAELELEGRPLTYEQSEVVCCPAGLDIGAATPEEIALSIIVEIKAVLAHTNGRQLKYRTKTPAIK